MNGIRHFLDLVFSLFFPDRCLVCWEPVKTGECFCKACEKKVPDNPLLRVFSVPGCGGNGFRVIAPLLYEGGFQKALYRYKFQGRRGMAKPLGRLMARCVKTYGEAFDLAAYVPLSSARRKKRGYDQSRLLAKAVAAELAIPLGDILEKHRENKTQHELSRQERKKNVRGVYRVRENAGVSGRRVLLVDDIVTTGATLRECAELLYGAGAAQVVGLSAADAERRGINTGGNAV